MFIESRGWRVVLAGVVVMLHCLPTQARVRELRDALWLDAADSPRAIVLPLAWDKVQPGRAGWVRLSIPWQLDGPADQPMALFIPKAGNAFELRVNGWLLLRRGDLQHFGSPDQGKLPHWVPIPQELLQPVNQIEVILRADEGRRAGLSSFWAGPQDELERRYRWHRFDRFSVTLFILSLSMGVGLLAFALAWTQRGMSHLDDRRNRSVFLIAGVSELCWSLRLVDYVWVEPPLTWALWGVVSSTAYLAWIACALMFSHFVSDLRVPWPRVALPLFVGGGVLIAIGSRLGQAPWLWTAWMGCIALALAVYGVWFGWNLVRHPSALRLLVAVAALANIAAGAWDWWVFRWLANPMGVGVMQRYTSVLFSLALLVIVLQRFRTASLRARDNLSHLDRLVAEKEGELAQAYRRQELWAREQARQQERVRIWRDLHDGLGAHLNTALRQLESQQMDRSVLAGTLRDGLLQLKLSVDAASLPPGDLCVMLGSLRYRLEPRFKSAGLSLDWQVDALPVLPLLESPQALREMQFIVYEALSNALQHARAQRLTVQARQESGGICLRIQDDGATWTEDRPEGRGMQSLRERARALNVKLSVTHGLQGSCVSLWIPLH